MKLRKKLFWVSTIITLSAITCIMLPYIIRYMRSAYSGAVNNITGRHSDVILFPDTDENAINEMIEEIQITNGFSTYDKQKILQLTTLLTHDYPSYTGKYMPVIEYNNVAYTIRGQFSKDISKAYIGEECYVEEVCYTHPGEKNEYGVEWTYIEEEVTFEVYQISDITTDYSLAVLFGDETYLYINDAYMPSGESLSEFLLQLGFDENAAVYVRLTRKDTEYGIFFTDISMKYLIDNFFSKGKNAYFEDNKRIAESEVTGLAIHITSAYTGGSLWLYYRDNGDIYITGTYYENAGLNKVRGYDMGDTSLTAGTELIGWLLENYEGMISYPCSYILE